MKDKAACNENYRLFSLYKNMGPNSLFTPSQATPLDGHGSLTGEIPCNPSEKGCNNLKEILCFIAGSMLGGTVGVFVMCLLQINRIERNDEFEKKEYFDKSSSLQR